MDGEIPGLEYVGWLRSPTLDVRELRLFPRIDCSGELALASGPQSDGDAYTGAQILHVRG